MSEGQGGREGACGFVLQNTVIQATTIWVYEREHCTCRLGRNGTKHSMREYKGKWKESICLWDGYQTHQRVGVEKAQYTSQRSKHSHACKARTASGDRKSCLIAQTHPIMLCMYGMEELYELPSIAQATKKSRHTSEDTWQMWMEAFNRITGDSSQKVEHSAVLWDESIDEPVQENPSTRQIWEEDVEGRDIKYITLLAGLASDDSALFTSDDNELLATHKQALAC